MSIHGHLHLKGIKYFAGLNIMTLFSHSTLGLPPSQAVANCVSPRRLIICGETFNCSRYMLGLFHIDRHILIELHLC